MTYSVVFSIPPAVRDLLAASTDTDLEGVAVLTGPRRVAAGQDSLAVQDCRASANRAVTGGYRRESGSFTLRAHVEVRGAGEDAIDAARERCDAILAAACAELEGDSTLDGITLFCDVTEVAEDDQSTTDTIHEFTAHAVVSFTADVQPGA